MRSFCQEVLRPIIVDAVKEAVPKELQKKDKQYYTRKQVCDMLHISAPTFYEKANEEINKLLKEGFENAEQMIRDNRDRVEKAAALLIRNKTITEEELRAVAAE